MNSAHSLFVPSQEIGNDDIEYEVLGVVKSHELVTSLPLIFFAHKHVFFYAMEVFPQNAKPGNNVTH